MQHFCPMCGDKYEGRASKATCSTRCRMAKMRGRGQALRFKPVRKGESKRTGNCVPTAIAEATGLAFQWVETMLLERGNQCKSGYKRHTWEPVIFVLGFVEVADAKGKLLDESLIEPGRIYLAVVREHMMCIRDGNFRDTFKSMKRRKRLLSLWVLRK